MVSWTNESDDEETRWVIVFVVEMNDSCVGRLEKRVARRKVLERLAFYLESDVTIADLADDWNRMEMEPGGGVSDKGYLLHVQMGDLLRRCQIDLEEAPS